MALTEFLPALTEFLLARIADREMLVRDMRHQAAAGRPLLEFRGGGTLIRELVDPAHVLAECEAKRQIVTACAQVSDQANSEASLNEMFAIDGCRFTLCQLAAIHAAHPDYREEWRP